VLLHNGEHACPFCLAPYGAALKFDKRGSPYTSCANCGSRAFLRTRASLLGLVALTDAIREIAARIESEPETQAAYQQLLDDFVGKLQARKAAPARAQPVATAEPAVPKPEAADG
jgi:hypothetical protein